MEIFDYNHKFYDGIFLLKLVKPTEPSLIAMSKGIENFENDIKAFEFCTPTTKDEFTQFCAFVNNYDDVFYYVLYLPQVEDGISYEIIIKSYQRCVSFFLKFLKDLIKAFSENEGSFDPNNVFDFTKSILEGWPKIPEKTMDMVFPDNLYTFSFSNDDFSCRDYNASNFFEPKIYTHLLANLISMRPILIQAPNAIFGCKSCFSLFSLLYPLRYLDPFILWLRKDDPRYSEIAQSKKSPYLVVASTLDCDEIKAKFDYVVECKQMFKTDEKIDAEFRNFFKNVLLTIQNELDSMCLSNPYSDVLELPWIGESFEAAMKSPKNKFMPGMGILKKFAKSKMVSNWRFRRAVKTFREILLRSHGFAFNGFTKEQMETTLKFLKSMEMFFTEDINAHQVLKKQMNLLTQLINK